MCDRMEKKQIIDKVKQIMKKAYIELQNFAKEVEKEGKAEDNMMDKINQIAEDTTKMRKGLIG